MNSNNNEIEITNYNVIYKGDLLKIRKVTKIICSKLNLNSLEQAKIGAVVSDISRILLEKGNLNISLFFKIKDKFLLISIKVEDIDKLIEKMFFDSSNNDYVNIKKDLNLIDKYNFFKNDGIFEIELYKKLNINSIDEKKSLKIINDEISKILFDDSIKEIKEQNIRFIEITSELNIKKKELEEINKELIETNKGILALTSELEDQKEALEKKHNELQIAFKELNRVNFELESFSYSVSHDLKAPLRHINGICDILKEHIEKSRDLYALDQIYKIEKVSADMKKLIENLLKLSKISLKKLERKMINLSNKVTEIFDSYEKQYPERRIELVCKENIIANVDETLIEIALKNLIENSFKFTSKKEKAVIKFGEKINKSKKIFFIKDNGAGFDNEYVDSVFEPFHRLHKTSEFKGTGIGTAIIKRVITRHNGEIWAEGELEKGATFFFTLE